MKSVLLKLFISLYLSAPFTPTQPPDCAGSGGCYTPSGEIWISPDWLDSPTPQRNHPIYHELGHQFDARYMTPAARRSFQYVIGDYRPWTEGNDPPNEKFAEAVAACFDGSYKSVIYVYHYTPTRDQYERICRLIEAVYTGQPRVV
jgi:hypothetical protein